MREGHIMERSHLIFTPTVMLIVIYLFSFVAQATQLKNTVSTLSPSMVVAHVQSGMESELIRQGYVTEADLSWGGNNKTRIADVDMTISISQSSPFITLVSQQGLSTDIYLDESELNNNSDVIESYEANFIKKLLPGINIMGVILDRNATDINNVEEFLAEQEYKGVRIIYHYIESSAELRSSTRELAPQVDAIYLPCHITDMPELNDIVTVAERNNVALIGEDHRSIDKGIFAVYNIDYVQVGRDTADLLVRLAENGYTDNYLAQPVLSLNLDAATRMGVELSSEVIDKANYIIE
ncbi:hypothetical protein HWV00_04060 [Moritella sp. 24]|uniref:ABC transporter substrate binding protein n=1 Tax=Moritella sp. 24 TaxID=2746230 RepID=UPI001BADD488|nr:ABC transporter substrate binding protein [Moritella sp. 24]QUM75472.1 hypothetical protein HWV00_04060 [Moritella sp. 24]